MKTMLKFGVTSLFAIALITGVAYAKKAPETYLATIMDRYHKTFDVYTEAHGAGNHFVMRGKMYSTGAGDGVPAMDESWTVAPNTGCTCIKASFQSRGSNWGGWYFMNGVIQGEERAPKENWGDYPNAGMDLQGAKALTFWAKGAKGGERVEFFALGVGWSVETGEPNMPYPDSSRKVSLGFVTLSPQWTRYLLDVNGKDLGYVVGGFGWVASASENNNQDIDFYLDDIRYDQATLDRPRFLVSYQTICSPDSPFDEVMRNVAFTYDNAVALIAFIASGNMKRAKLLADALVYAQNHDRFYADGRVRNAYQGGDLVLPPGWTPHGKVGTVRMPGWYDTQAGTWYEDEFQVSTHTGNVAWAMLALLDYYQAAGGKKYLNAAKKMGEWVENQCYDDRGAGGYTGGYEGWEPNTTKLLYKATEHNIDLYAAFQKLYGITKDVQWKIRANHAKRFVRAMWDEEKFWTGTGDDGITVNEAVLPVDIQAWSILALKEKGKQYWGALDYAQKHHRVGAGYDFNEDRDGVWFEGTSQVAVANGYIGNTKRWQRIVNFLKTNQNSSGGLPAADRDGLTTGFDLSSGDPWLYYRRLHVGATGWMELALKKFNPF